MNIDQYRLKAFLHASPRHRLGGLGIKQPPPEGGISIKVNVESPP